MVTGIRKTGRPKLETPDYSDATQFLHIFDPQDDVFARADFFMCSEPVFFCGLLARFGRPLIGYFANPVVAFRQAVSIFGTRGEAGVVGV